MARKSTIEKLEKVFDEEFDLIGDFDFVVRLSKISKIEVIMESLAVCKWHGKNLSITNKNHLIEEMVQWHSKNNNLFKEYKEIKLYENLINFLKVKQALQEGNQVQLGKELNLGIFNVLVSKLKNRLLKRTSI